MIALRATVYPKTENSGNRTWKAKIGRHPDGKFEYRNFRGGKEGSPEDEAGKQQAEAFAREWNAKLLNGQTSGIQDLNDISRHEILAAIGKLKEFNASLPEAVEFFIKHAKPAKGKITIKEAIQIFLQEKERAGRRPAYLRSCKKTYYPPFRKFFSESKLLIDVTEDEAKKYIEANKLNWKSKATRSAHIGYLQTLYNFLIEQKYATLNPFGGIEKPYAPSTQPKIMFPHEVKSLLEFALNEGRKAECACMALVFFCGVRGAEMMANLNE